jgi:hypothetical protein
MNASARILSGLTWQKSGAQGSGIAIRDGARARFCIKRIKARIVPESG